MTGYMNNDGSELVGALNPSGVGQALQVDASGNLKTTATLSAASEQNVNLNQVNGTALGTSNPVPVAGPVNLADPTTPANKLAVDASGKLGVNSLPALPAGSNLVGGIQVIDSGGTNKLAVDASGKIGINALPANQSVNLVQVLGAALGPSNPVLTEANIQNFMRSGQGFSTTTGKQTSGGAITTGLSIFNPNASGKTLIVFSVRVAVGSSNFHTLALTTTDPALGTSATIANSKPGGAASIVSASFANTAVSIAGTTFDVFQAIASTMTEGLTNGAILVIPPNNGAALYVATATNNWVASLKWLEI